MKKSFKIDKMSIGLRFDRWIRNNIGKIPQSLIEKDIRKGRISPGIKIDPNMYQSFTTDGIIKAKLRAIKAVTINPSRIKFVDVISHSLLFIPF